MFGSRDLLLILGGRHLSKRLEVRRLQRLGAQLSELFVVLQLQRRLFLLEDLLRQLPLPQSFLLRIIKILMSSAKRLQGLLPFFFRSGKASLLQALSETRTVKHCGMTVPSGFFLFLSQPSSRSVVSRQPFQASLSPAQGAAPPVVFVRRPLAPDGSFHDAFKGPRNHTKMWGNI